MINIFANTQQVTKKITTKEELSHYLRNYIHNNGKPEMNEEDHKKMQARIMGKLESGKKLSKEEMDYLKKYDPIMYVHALRVQKMAEAVKERLKHANSKEAADRIISSAITGISDKDPDKKYIVAAVNRISTEFHKSGAYSKLPNTEEEAKKCANRKAASKISDDEENNDENDFNLFNWNPLQEVFVNMPTFTANA